MVPPPRATRRSPHSAKPNPAADGSRRLMTKHFNLTPPLGGDRRCEDLSSMCGMEVERDGAGSERMVVDDFG